VRVVANQDQFARRKCKRLVTSAAFFLRYNAEMRVVELFVAACLCALAVVSSCNGRAVVTPPTTFSITGRAMDGASGAGISGVTIMLDPSQLSTQTDSEGNYSFNGLAPEIYTLSAADALGFDAFTPPSINATLGPDSPGNEFTAIPAGTTPVTYESGAGSIKTLMDAHCAVCHNPDFGQQPYLRSWAEVMPNLALVDSRVLPPPDGIEDMPQRPQQLTPAERAKFVEWKNNGHSQ
jgi:mono/diheme cytochrome c family protein